MMNKKIQSFIKSHNLVNRIYDMLIYFNVIKQSESEILFKKFFKDNLLNNEYVESLAKYFEDQLKKKHKNIELRCNLTDLISDLDYLKQYLV